MKMVKKAKSIVVGHYNEIMKNNIDLSKERMKICERCPLLKQDPNWGPICNSKLYLNTNTMETSETIKVGYTKGCGCRLNAKTKDKEAHCPTQQW